METQGAYEDNYTSHTLPFPHPSWFLEGTQNNLPLKLAFHLFCREWSFYLTQRNSRDNFGWQSTHNDKVLKTYKEVLTLATQQAWTRSKTNSRLVLKPTYGTLYTGPEPEQLQYLMVSVWNPKCLSDSPLSPPLYNNLRFYLHLKNPQTIKNEYSQIKIFDFSQEKVETD